MFIIIDALGTILFKSTSENKCDKYFKNELRQRAMEGEDFYLLRRDKTVEGGWDFRGVYYYEDENFMEMSRINKFDLNSLSKPKEEKMKENKDEGPQKKAERHNPTDAENDANNFASHETGIKDPQEDWKRKGIIEVDSLIYPVYFSLN